MNYDEINNELPRIIIIRALNWNVRWKILIIDFSIATRMETTNEKYLISRNIKL